MAKIEWHRILTLIGTLCLAGYGIVGLIGDGQRRGLQEVLLLIGGIALLAALSLDLYTYKIR